MGAGWRLTIEKRCEFVWCCVVFANASPDTRRKSSKNNFLNQAEQRLACYSARSPLQRRGPVTLAARCANLSCALRACLQAGQNRRTATSCWACELAQSSASAHRPATTCAARCRAPGAARTLAKINIARTHATDTRKGCRASSAAPSRLLRVCCACCRTATSAPSETRIRATQRVLVPVRHRCIASARQHVPNNPCTLGNEAGRFRGSFLLAARLLRLLQNSDAGTFRNSLPRHAASSGPRSTLLHR